MRTADELIQAALLTGTYFNYVGDGATIPWEDVIPPADMLLYSYKVYLDSRWPEAFKLHDWCYTPYGSLIQVTRDEADSALFEIINRDSPRDALIVYTAVRLGGGQYFGLSMTGFVGIPRTNIAVTPTRSFGMPTKCVMLFKDLSSSTNPALTRIAGWSESVYHTSDDPTIVMNTLKNGSAGKMGLLPARAGCLPDSASIIGIRLYKGGSGKGTSQNVKYPGNGAWPTDIPQMALQLSCKSALTGGIRRWLIRAIPDQFVTNGTFTPDNSYVTAVALYLQSLENFAFYSKTTTETGFHINTIVQLPPVPPATASTGLVTTLEPHSFVANDQVTIYSTVLANTSKKTITTRVLAVQGPNSFSVPNWTDGNTTGGIAGSPLRTIDAFTFAGTGIGYITVRKTGRPFDLYRGRRSKRRKVA